MYMYYKLTPSADWPLWFFLMLYIKYENTAIKAFTIKSETLQ